MCPPHCSLSHPHPYNTPPSAVAQTPPSCGSWVRWKPSATWCATATSGWSSRSCWPCCCSSCWASSSTACQATLLRNCWGPEGVMGWWDVIHEWMDQGTGSMGNSFSLDTKSTLEVQLCYFDFLGLCLFFLYSWATLMFTYNCEEKGGHLTKNPAMPPTSTLSFSVQTKSLSHKCFF